MASSPLKGKHLNPRAKSWSPEPPQDLVIVKKSPYLEYLCAGDIKFPHELFSLGSQQLFSAQMQPRQCIMYPQLQQPTYCVNSVVQQPVVSPCTPGGQRFYGYGLVALQPRIFEHGDGVIQAKVVGSVPNSELSDAAEGAYQNDGKNVAKEILHVFGAGEERKSDGKFVPHRLRKGCTLECQGKNALRKVWNEKKTKSCDSFVSSASPPRVLRASEEEIPSCNNTTVMIKNIPYQYRRRSFMEFLNHYCREHQLEYDFLYLPMDFWTGRNMGFAFVNFTSAADALKLFTVLQDYKWGTFTTTRHSFSSNKIIQITWAKIQGKDALVRHFKTSLFTCNNPGYLPVVLSPPANGSTSHPSFTTLGKLVGFNKSSKTFETLS